MKPAMQPQLPLNSQRGAMMLEALIGILIFSTGILALIGMQALAISYASDAKYRADASFLANQVIAEMWVNRPTISTYAYAGSGAVPAPISGWVTAVESTLPGATSNKPIIAVDVATGQVSVTVRWRPANAEAVRNHRSIALITNP
jgi:type IV pilus assembly protein PilV